MNQQGTDAGLRAVALLLIEARDRLESLHLAEADELWSEISRAHGHCSLLQQRAAELQTLPGGTTSAD